MAASTQSTPHAISIVDIDYLQRSAQTLSPLDLASVPSAPPALRRLWRVDSVGVVEKQPVPRENEPRTRPRLPSEDLLTGLYGAKIRLAFILRGEPHTVQVHLGTWAPQGQESSRETPSDRQEVLRAALSGLYPAVSVSPNDPGDRNDEARNRSQPTEIHRDITGGNPAARMWANGPWASQRRDVTAVSPWLD